MDFVREGLSPSTSPVPVLDLPGPSRRIVVEPLEAPERPVELPEREPSEPGDPGGPSEDPARTPTRSPDEIPA
jgi:hypothetical protein